MTPRYSVRYDNILTYNNAEGGGIRTHDLRRLAVLGSCTLLKSGPVLYCALLCTTRVQHGTGEDDAALGH